MARTNQPHYFAWLIHPDFEPEKCSCHWISKYSYFDCSSCSSWLASRTNFSFYISPSLSWWIYFWRWRYLKWRIYLKYWNWLDLNDLIRDLELTKFSPELLTSRLKQWNLLNDSVHVTEQCKRYQNFFMFLLLCKREFSFATVLVDFWVHWNSM